MVIGSVISGWGVVFTLTKMARIGYSAPTMNFAQLFSFAYWFERVFPMSSSSMLIFAGVCLALIVVGAWFLKKSQKKTVQSALSRGAVELGAYEAIWLFFHYQEIPLLWQRGVALIIALLVLYKTAKAYYFIVKVLPSKRAANIAQEIKAKYLRSR